ncbi:UPF0262 family protein [Mangrovicoccus algicola]|uniref:UPF0262 family protein n=1 Tax=Mangrovicoccus algicola TaxID=2771008 RepID=A0A8J6YV37_9RHOB|nr:UPF0262 family protein [Mangrovicoccus algicola]MBE3636709.1 UPF0262 family protein [Mangrovicoccus algicola]
MTDRLSHIDLDPGEAGSPSPQMLQEQQVAVFDLLEENSFALPDGPPGPYRLVLGRSGSRVSFDLTVADGVADGVRAGRFDLSLGPLRQVVKDYGEICAGYYEAVKTARASEIEALDDARRAIHREGARALVEGLAGKAAVDAETARRLFTLVCVLLSEDRP